MANDETMKIKGLVKYLKFAEKIAYRFASEGELPRFKVGRCMGFRKNETDCWISSKNQKIVIAKKTT